ncbi:MAG: isoleucine--tRNA ligase [Candidatus Neomarinimicrobiota bacterium]
MSINKENPKIDFVKNEHEILDYWAKENTFKKLVSKNQKGPKWSFLDGPITANNPMGVHHAWGRTLKDLYQRYKSMNGFQQRYQNGFDCQGLWVEIEVEKELGIKSKKEVEELGIEKFVNLCKERVEKFSEIQKNQSIRLGYWMDWENSYYTMSEENNYAIWAFLKKLFEDDKIYRGTDVVPWSGRSGTSYSQMEIIEGRKLTVHKGVFVKFAINERSNEHILIWTTTPWTLSSNIAVAVNKKINYAKVQIQDGTIFYVAETNLKYQRLSKEFSEKKNWVEGVPKLKTLDQIFKERGGYEVLEVLKGEDLVGLTYKGPFDHLEPQNTVGGFPIHDTSNLKKQSAVDCHIVIDGGKDSEGNDMVVEGEGTGFVHMAGGCGAIDNKICKKEGFVEISPIDNQANFIDGFDFMSGLSVTDPDTAQKIIDDLKDRNLLLYVEDYPHIYPHCWRSGDELVFKQVDEWYINMDWREKIKSVVDDINWIPAWGRDREHDWLDNMGDWMISKKRFWGLALPIWTFEDGSFHVVGSKEELKELAVEGWEKFEGNSPHRPWVDYVKIKHPKTGLVGKRIKDVGNPWLDAGIVPFSTMKYFDDKSYWEEWFPADFITECFPGQFRNWFYSLLAMSSFLEGKSPFKTLLGHALVKDESGAEMHKSAGNAIWFDDAAEKMGVDVMRWMYSKQNVENNLLFGYDKADEVRKKLISLWNVYSFFCTYANLDDFKPHSHDISDKDLSLLDRWIISKSHQLTADAKLSYENFEVDKLLRNVESFLDDLSNWYIRRNRRRFWKSENDADKFVAYQTLYEVLLDLIKILSPIIPFVAERMYLNITKDDDNENNNSIHLSSFPQSDHSRIDNALIEKVDSLKRVIESGRAVRKKANIKVRQPLNSLKVYTVNKEVKSFIQKQADIAIDELNIKEVVFSNNIDEFGKLSLKPNFKNLKMKFGDEMQEAMKSISTLNAKKVLESLLHGNSFPENSFELSKDDILITLKAEEGSESFLAKDLIVCLDTTISEQLRLEGVLRDLIRQIQLMRKEADFNIDDRIIISGSFKNELKDVISENKDYFMNEVLCTDIVENMENSDYNASFMHENQKIEIHIKKVERG